MELFPDVLMRDGGAEGVLKVAVNAKVARITVTGAGVSNRRGFTAVSIRNQSVGWPP